MKPILFEFLSIPLRSYGLLVAIGFLVGTAIATKVGKERGFTKENINDVVFVMIISAIIGSRLLHVLTNYENYISRPLDVFKVWNGGLVFYGGLIAVIGSLFVYCYKKGFNIMKIFDVLVVGLPLGHMFGRFGCTMAGCCHGKPVLDELGNRITDAAHAPWYAIKFPEGVGSFAPTDSYLYASQLYESAYNLVIFLIMYFVIRKLTTRTGVMLGSYLIMYGIMRSINEIYRGDEDRKFFIENVISTSQGISVVMILFALYLIFVYSRKHPN